MAKLTQKMLQLGAPARVPGQYYIRNTKYGPVVQKWPKKRPLKKSPGALYQEWVWANACTWASSPDPGQLDSAITYAKGTMNVPRDFLTMNAYGTHTTFYLDDGTRLVSYREVTANAQFVLDQLTDQPLSIIWRNNVGWLAAQPTANGQVLAYQDGDIKFTNLLPPPSPFDAGSGTNQLPYWGDTDMYLVPPSVGGNALGSLALAANRITFVPLIVPYNRTFTSFAFSIPTGGAVAASNARVGLYLLDTINGGPGTVALDIGSIATATIGLKTVSFSQALARGVYFAAIWSSAAITIRGLTNTFSLATTGFDMNAGTPAPSNFLTFNATYGGAFADMSANTMTTNTASTSTPLLGIR